jgi:hypothetical protein
MFAAYILYIRRVLCLRSQCTAPCNRIIKLRAVANRRQMLRYIGIYIIMLKNKGFAAESYLIT